MKLYFEKEKCTVSESINGRYIEIETDDGVLIDPGYGPDCLLWPPDSMEGAYIRTYNKPTRKDSKVLPYLTLIPKGYKLQ